MAPTTTPTPSSQTSTTRTATSARGGNETTLTNLTRRFLDLLDNSTERVIDLNDASRKLVVPKRRIYDITNVLEGIGLLTKIAKNKTKWIDCPSDSAFAAPNARDISDRELNDLRQTYELLDEGVKEMEENISKIRAGGSYVTYQDFKTSFKDQTVIAIKAPPDTFLLVDDQHVITVKCERSEPIEVYLCPQYANTNNINNPTQLQPPQPHHHHQQPQKQQNGYQINTSPHLQQSQLNNSSNTQPLETTITNTSSSTLIGQQQTQQIYNMPVSSDEGRGRSSTTTDGQYYESTSGVSNDDHYYINDPTLSSALSGTTSEDEDPFKPLVPFDSRDETYYNFTLENCSLSSLFPDDNLGMDT